MTFYGVRVYANKKALIDMSQDEKVMCVNIVEK